MEEGMETIREQIKKKIESMQGQASPKELRMQEEALIKILEEGKPVHEAIGVSKQSLEYMYSHAYSLYNAAKYEQAKQIFYILNFLDEQDARFPYGVAACYHMMKNHTNALAMYLSCLMREPDNPILFWHIADCYSQMGKKVTALITLRMCVRQASKDPSFEPLKIRAEREFLVLEREVEEEVRKGQKESQQKESQDNKNEPAVKPKG